MKRKPLVRLHSVEQTSYLFLVPLILVLAGCQSKSAAPIPQEVPKIEAAVSPRGQDLENYFGERDAGTAKSNPQIMFAKTARRYFESLRSDRSELTDFADDQGFRNADGSPDLSKLNIITPSLKPEELGVTVMPTAPECFNYNLMFGKRSGYPYGFQSYNRDLDPSANHKCEFVRADSRDYREILNSCKPSAQNPNKTLVLGYRLDPFSQLSSNNTNLPIVRAEEGRPFHVLAYCLETSGADLTRQLEHLYVLDPQGLDYEIIQTAGSTVSVDPVSDTGVSQPDSSERRNVAGAFVAGSSASEMPGADRPSERRTRLRRPRLCHVVGSPVHLPRTAADRVERAAARVLA
jgi:hypothetical protein